MNKKCVGECSVLEASREHRKYCIFCRKPMQEVINNLRKEIEKLRINGIYYMVALNLSGQREELEQKAAELINKYSYFEALKISKEQK